MLSIKGKKIYLIGIKGTGMASLAIILKKVGYQVTGSDVENEFPTQSQLDKNNIKYLTPFHAKNIATAKPDLIIASTAYGDTNPEIAEAKKKC